MFALTDCEYITNSIMYNLQILRLQMCIRDRLWTAFMGICASAAGGIKSFFKAGGTLIKKIVLKIWSLISLLWFKIKGLFGRKEKPVQSETCLLYTSASGLQMRRKEQQDRWKA